jgi:threonine dehydratase
MPPIGLADIEAAHSRIHHYLPWSGIKESLFLRKQFGKKILLKLENLNLSGSFKIRGALSALTALTEDQLKCGVLAASAGNHAQGLAYSGRLLKSEVTIFMPKRAPLVKVQSTRDLGAEVHLVGENYDESFEAAMAYQKTTGKIMIHGFANPEVIAGQGTIAIEMMKQASDLGMVIASIGGGGLMSGLLTAIKAKNPEILVIGVQSKAFPAMEISCKNQDLTEAVYGNTIADGIAVKKPAKMTYDIIKNLVDDIILVDEQDLSQSILTLMERDHLLAEGAGVAPIAALKYLRPDLLDKLGDRSIGCIISGGNIDVNLMRRIIPHALRSVGRLMRISVMIPDLPGRLADLLNLVSKTGANLQEVHHNRLFGIEGFENVEVKLDLETLDGAHKSQIVATLEKSGFHIRSLDL